MVAHAIDWYPTLASLAGIPISKGLVLDGRDLSALLTGKTNTIPLCFSRSVCRRPAAVGGHRIPVSCIMGELWSRVAGDGPRQDIPPAFSGRWILKRREPVATGDAEQFTLKKGASR